MNKFKEGDIVTTPIIGLTEIGKIKKVNSFNMGNPSITTYEVHFFTNRNLMQQQWNWFFANELIKINNIDENVIKLLYETI